MPLKFRVQSSAVNQARRTNLHSPENTGVERAKEEIRQVTAGCYRERFTNWKTQTLETFRNVHERN
ncbi:Hypothetical protein SMAX5B_005566 [Scophthalmus maximus]|uniref:Uncharacterized protein n=1 Tax=Scophthalmus maximus TaxID=52904 RepID=A0A2U9BF30_SCOMX|nr:Hypothetical protein SMAX5B_005566 [Scophthalmus maximus]